MPQNNPEIIEYIDHTGRIENINGPSRLLRVRLSDDGHDCGGCPAAKLCGASSGAQFIDVPVKSVVGYEIGDKVRLRGTERMHRRAIMLATVFPCIALIAIMVLIYVLTYSQVWAALGGIAAMLIFYLCLYLARNKVEHEFGFEVQKEC